MYENSDARPGTYDFVGKISVHDFIYPPDTSESTSTIVVMDKVLRQDNLEFLFLFNNLRMGTVCDNYVDFILNRCLNKMDNGTRQHFQQYAINLDPTWKMAHMITYKYLDLSDTLLVKIKAKL